MVRHGFTLLEMLVVVLIMGLLAAVAVPSFGVVEEIRQEQAAESLAGTLRRARAEAVATGYAHRVSVDLGSDTVAVDFDDGSSITTALDALGREPSQAEATPGNLAAAAMATGGTTGDGTVVGAAGVWRVWFDFKGVPHDAGVSGALDIESVDDAVLNFVGGGSVTVYALSGLVE